LYDTIGDLVPCEPVGIFSLFFNKSPIRANECSSTPHRVELSETSNTRQCAIRLNSGLTLGPCHKHPLQLIRDSVNLISAALRSYFPSIHTIGYDISEEVCRDYRANTGAVAYLVDLTKLYSPDQSHDAALVIGGLHHCVMDLSTTLKNVASMVRPGGHFMMMEPSDNSFLSGACLV
jgi:hypothetical protein